MVAIVDLLGVNIHPLSLEELLKYIHNSILDNRKVTILSGNARSFIFAQKYVWYKEYMNNADIIRIDGNSIRKAIKFLYKTILPDRITWADFGWELAKYSRDNKLSLYFLGGREEILKVAKLKLEIKFKDIRILGYQHGYYNKNKDSRENQNVIKNINKLKPDIVIVGFGMPIQEKWLSENRENIMSPVILTGGAVFDYLSGMVKRGPAILIKIKMEWLGRLIIEPRRLFKRYLFENSEFIYRVLIQKINLIKK